MKAVTFKAEHASKSWGRTCGFAFRASYHGEVNAACSKTTLRITVLEHGYNEAEVLSSNLSSFQSVVLTQENSNVTT